MSDIRQWLEQLGFGKYADAFEREEVDLDAVPMCRIKQGWLIL